MKVYVHGSMLVEDYAAQLVPVEVIAVHDCGIDFVTEDGARYIDWRAKLYDEYENEIPLERIQRDFLMVDLDTLRERVEKLEAIVTNV